jgi:hypothetical protein
MVRDHDIPDRYHSHCTVFRYEGEGNTNGLLLPLYGIMELHAGYIAQKMPEL